MNEHTCEIFHADWPLVRSWGVRCSICGLFAACLDEQEAVDCMEAHKKRLDTELHNLLHSTQ